MRKILKSWKPRMICKKCRTVHVGRSYFSRAAKDKYPTYRPFTKFKCKICGSPLELYEKAWFGTKDTVLFKVMVWVGVPFMAFIAFVTLKLLKIFFENLWAILIIEVLVVGVVFFGTGFIFARIRRKKHAPEK